MKTVTVLNFYIELSKRGYINPRLPDENAENIGQGDLMDLLELDRRTIFIYWFGEAKALEYGSNKPMWHYHYTRAESDYINGYAETTIQYILAMEILKTEVQSSDSPQKQTILT